MNKKKLLILIAAILAVIVVALVAIFMNTKTVEPNGIAEYDGGDSPQAAYDLLLNQVPVAYAGNTKDTISLSKLVQQAKLATQLKAEADPVDYYVNLPSADTLIAECCKLLGAPYNFGAKGYENPYFNNEKQNVAKSLSTNRQNGVDCSGLVYWAMSNLGYGSSGFFQLDTPPIDSIHWITNDSSAYKLTYKGETVPVNVEKWNELHTARPYWQMADGSTIAPGSVVVVQRHDNKSGNHVWIYLGEFKDRDAVIEYLKSIGVDKSLLTKKNIEAGNAEGGTHWRIESTMSDLDHDGKDEVAQVCINNRVRGGLTHDDETMYAFQVTSHNDHKNCAKVEAGKKPTCEAEGTTDQIFCTFRNKIVQEHQAIPATGHDWVEKAGTAATCTKPGTATDKTCKVCNKIELGEPTNQLMHKYVDGKCTMCGKVQDKTATSIDRVFDGYGIVRAYGDSRYQTSLQAAELMKQAMNATTFGSVIIASGEDFADALSGSGLSAKVSAPILLVDPNNYQNVNDKTLAYIKQNLVPNGTIFILGGTNAVPETTETALKAISANTIRLFGETRYDTNVAILNEIENYTESKELLVCSATSYADALSVSATGKPVMLVDPVTGTLTEGQKEYLNKRMPNTIYIIGGESAVPASIEGDITANTGVVPTRLFGANRYETSEKVASALFGKDITVVTLAYGENYPDGLCAGPVAYQLGAPLLLVMPNEYGNTFNDIARDYVATLSGDVKLLAFGGPGSNNRQMTNAVIRGVKEGTVIDCK